MQEIELLGEEQKRCWLNGLLRELILFQIVPVFVSEQDEPEAVSAIPHHGKL